jgi:hypothetical protein
MIFLLVAGALIVGAPILAAMLVSVASLREDAERSLVGHPPGKLAAAVRRLLSVRTDGAQAADPGQASSGAAVASPALTSITLPYLSVPRPADSEQADYIRPAPQR